MASINAATLGSAITIDQTRVFSDFNGSVAILTISTLNNDDFYFFNGLEAFPFGGKLTGHLYYSDDDISLSTLSIPEVQVVVEGTSDYNNPNNNTNANENTNSNNFPGHPSNFNWESDNSSNKSSENNQQTVIDYISVNDETDAKFKSYTTINYANSDIQNVSQKVNAILAANPKWSKMDALNYLDGKWAKQGWKNQDGTPDNRPRWNNGKLKNL